MLQIAGKGRYTGPLISGRFQILESFIRGSFVVVDHQEPGLLVREAGPLSKPMRFYSKKAAEGWISLFTDIKVPRIEKRPYRTFKKGVEMKTNAKKATPKKTAAPVRKAARKAAPAARKAAPKQAARKAKTEARKAVRTAVKTVLKAKRKGRGLSKSGTISATIREMILAKKLTDEQILAETGKIFGRKIPTTAVKHYRGVLANYGML